MASELETLIQIAGGAGGAGAVLGYWLFRSLKRIDQLEKRVEELSNARLSDYKVLVPALRDVGRALRGEEAAGEEDPAPSGLMSLDQPDREPPRERRETGRRRP